MCGKYVVDRDFFKFVFLLTNFQHFPFSKLLRSEEMNDSFNKQYQASSLPTTGKKKKKKNFTNGIKKIHFKTIEFP